MNLTGRTSELGVLRTWFDGRDPSFIRIHGPSGVGKTRLVHEAARDFSTVHHRCPPLPDPSQRAALAATLLRAPGIQTEAAELLGGPPPGWAELFRVMDGLATGSAPTLFILDDAHRLTEARSRVSSGFLELYARRTQSGGPWHVVLCGRPGALPSLPDEEAATALDLALAPLTFRASLPFLPGATPREMLESYGVFGGTPGILRLVDPQATLGTNIRRLLLDADAPLASWGTLILERELQTPSRYAAILGALSAGESSWSTVHAGVTDLTTSGQVAPYLKRLEEMGLVQVRRSLDARPKSRNRRYRIVDPFLSFWYRAAHLAGWRLGEEEALQGKSLRDAVGDQAAAVLPEVCRQFMDHDAMEILGHNARECGSLWSANTDIDVAGILRSGAAFYGRVLWGEPPTSRDLRALDHAIRETRYGFGREARLRILFATGETTPETQRAVARRHDTFLLSLNELAGEG